MRHSGMDHAQSHYDVIRHRLHAALTINGLVILAEFVGGWWIDSMGVMSDAGHNLIDQGALFLALYAHMLASKPATEARTFGYHRAGIVSALISSLILLLSAAGIAFWAITRLTQPVPVRGGWMIALALFAFAANLAVALLLQRGAESDLNLRGAMWHMLGDAWVSLGVVLSGLAIMYTGWTVLDPIVSLLIVGVIGYGAWPILRESVEVLLESTPPGIKTAHVVEAIERIPGVRNVHDLHIWAVEPRLIMLTCHVQVDGDDSHLTGELLQTIRRTVTAEFGIKHLTIQLETQCCGTAEVHCNLSHLTTSASTPSLHSHGHVHSHAH